MRPFKNEVKFDPGRFRYKIIFSEESITDDGFGGQVVGAPIETPTLAIRETIRGGNQVAVNAGLLSFEGDCTFVIRARPGFTPKKTMSMSCGTEKYTIVGMESLGVPTTHIRLYCKSLDTLQQP